MYIYPDNLKSKATLWLWELRDIGIIGILDFIRYAVAFFFGKQQTYEWRG